MRGVRLSITAEVASGYYALRAVDTQLEILDATAGGPARKFVAQRSAHQGGHRPARRTWPAPAWNSTTSWPTWPRPAASATTSKKTSRCSAASPHPTSTCPRARWSGPCPPSLPPRVPAGLLTRRPDVAASERRLAATLQDIHQAKAEERPRITVGGYVGQMSVDAEHFADRKSHEASIMPVISLPVFEGRSARRQRQAGPGPPRRGRRQLSGNRAHRLPRGGHRPQRTCASAPCKPKRRPARSATPGTCWRFSTDRYNHQTASYFPGGHRPGRLAGGSTQHRPHAQRTLRRRRGTRAAPWEAAGRKGRLRPTRVTGLAPASARKRRIVALTRAGSSKCSQWVVPATISSRPWSHNATPASATVALQETVVLGPQHQHRRLEPRRFLALLPFAQGPVVVEHRRQRARVRPRLHVTVQRARLEGVLAPGRLHELAQGREIPRAQAPASGSQGSWYNAT